MKDILNLQTRRQFLQTGALGGALSWTIPSFLANTFASLHAQAAGAQTQTPTGKDATILVLVQLAGGNDGLNTVAPYANDFYHKARPSLALNSEKILKLNDDFGLHPSLAGFKSLYDAGELAIIHGVGYPNPNRSHFRSTEIWQTASDSNKFEKYGWLGRYFDNACKGADPTVGVSIGREMPQAFASKHPLGVSLENPESYRFANSDEPAPDEKMSSEPFFKKLNTPLGEEMEMANSGSTIGSVGGKVVSSGSALDYLERTALDAQISSEKILAVSRKVTNQATYPGAQIASSLKLVARLIGGGLPTRVYYVSQGGYDTHTNQAPAQERLLRELGDSVKAFLDDIKAQGNADRVLLMTFSEFGRRVAQNANNGTDHGAAAPLFVAGAKIKAGLHGKFPSLAPEDLHNGDLKFTTDFRSIYARLLEDWLKTDSAVVLGRKFEPFKFA